MESKILPDFFGAEKRWVNYKIVDREGKKTKVPLNPSTGNNASSTDEKDWSTYDVALSVSKKVGIVFTPDKTLLGIDIDHCLKDGEILHEQGGVIEKLIEEADSYTEISPSGDGLHIFLALTGPLELMANRKSPFECYTAGRYFTVTNSPFKKVRQIRTVTVDEANNLLRIIGYPWQKQPVTLKKKPIVTDSITTEIKDDELLQKIFSSKNGDSFRDLYNGNISKYEDDHSRADMALVGSLGFWTGKNAEQIKRIWLSSPLGMRDKTQERSDYVTRTISSAIENNSEVYSNAIYREEEQSDEKQKRESKDARILKALFKREDLVLFHDEKSETYISLEIDGHREVWPLKSKSTKMFLNRLSWINLGSTLKSEEVKNIIGVLQGKAHFEGKEIKLHNRVAWFDGALYYDFTNDKYQVAKVTTDGWEIVDKTPIIFNRYNHQKPQLIPVKNGDIKLLLKYVLINGKEHQLLFIVLIVSYFIPNFPHAMMVLYGSHGGAKTTTSRIARLVVDPSIMEATSLGNNIKELIQQLAHHHFIPFDNVSRIPEDVSDTLCKAVSGGGFSKRELYSDDEDIIYVIQRCIAINGINLVTTRADLLDRSLLIELQRVDDSIRKDEFELYGDLERDMPSILGGVFDVLVKAIALRPTIKVRPERMADFTYWGCAIAEAIGYTQEEFLSAYRNNTMRQTEMLLNDNVVATAIIAFMEDKEEWKNTPSKLLDALYSEAHFANIDTREKYWPKGASALSRRLNELSTSLKKVGISVVTSTNGIERYIHITKITSKEKLAYVEQQVFNDGTDDISVNLK
jgi:hypothetical protein